MKKRNRKSITQWLKTLPKPLRDSAMKQSSKSSDVIYRDTLSGAIMGFQCWAETEEGSDFWNGFYITLREAERLENKNQYIY